MTTHPHEAQRILPPDAPAIDGLTFRGFRGERDYPRMLSVIEGSKEADGQQHSETLEDLIRNYQHLTHCNPATDMIFAEVHGEVIGYGRVWWVQVEEGPRLYPHFAFLLPAWRHKGVRRAMLRHNERRLRQIAAGHATDAPRVFESWASETERDWTRLLEAEGYDAVRYGFEMRRPIIGDLPDHPLPEGLEVRPVQPAHIPCIWDAAREAFRDHWGYAEDEWAPTHLEAWRKDPTFQPHLWQVAWDGDEIAGMVLNFISTVENEEYRRQRGYTETICVRRPWRRRGLARALITRSFRVHQDQGMTEVALGVDALNPNGALQLYESLGYQVEKRTTTYRKPLA
jgi:GNAT superfamily N-acetyltransferase